MALVNYGNSSSDESDDEALSMSVNAKEKPLMVKNIESKSLASMLAAKKSSAGLIQITAPTFAELDTSSDEEDQPAFKQKPSASGSRLSVLLPKPKSSGPINKAHPEKEKTSITQLVPDSLRLKLAKPTLPPPKKIKPTIEDDDKVIDAANFFSLPTEQVPKQTIADEIESRVTIAPEMDSNPPVVNTIAYLEAGPSPASGMSDLQLKKKIARKFGDETADQIQLVDVNVNDHLYQNKEYLKTISLETPQEVKGETPNPTAKRKHQITYLAHQAKQRELALKNEWAANKLAKNQTRAKYGF